MRIRMTQILCAGAGAIVFSILLEQITFMSVLLGTLLGVLFTVFVRSASSSKSNPFSILRLVRYLILLLKDIVVATVHQIYTVLRHEPPEPVILHLSPTVSERGRILVANSITLTPGTVTLEESEDTYVVLCSEPPSNNESLLAVSGDFEKRIEEKEELK